MSIIGFILLLASVKWFCDTNGEVYARTNYILLPERGNFYTATRLCHKYGMSVPFDNGTSLETFLTKHAIQSTWLNIRLHDMHKWKWVNGSEGFCPTVAHLQCMEFKGRQLLVGCQTKSWFTARATCKRHTGELLVISNEIKQPLLHKFLPHLSCPSYKPEFFIGLRRFDLFSVGLNDERQDIDHRKWQEGEPSQHHDCVQVQLFNNSIKSGWKTTDCFSKNRIVCQYPEQIEKKVGSKSGEGIPKITLSHSVAKSNSNVTIKCRIEGMDPTAIRLWTKVEAGSERTSTISTGGTSMLPPYSASPRYELQTVEEGNVQDHYMYIKDFQIEDFGTYTCAVLTNQGYISQKAQLDTKQHNLSPVASKATALPTSGTRKIIRILISVILIYYTN